MSTKHRPTRRITRHGGLAITVAVLSVVLGLIPLNAMTSGTHLIVEHPDGEVRGIGPSTEVARSVTVTLRGADGVLRAEGFVRWWAGAREWLVELEDADGFAVGPLPGDVVKAIVDDEVISFTVPPAVRLMIDRESGRVSGTTTPDSTVIVSTTAKMSAHGHAGPSGAFEVEFGEPLLANSEIVIDVVDDLGHRMRYSRLVPWARISTRPGDVIGASAPWSRVGVELRSRDGELRAGGRAHADVHGRWMLWLRNASGQRVRPRDGDNIIIDDADGIREMPVHEPHTDLRADGSITGAGVPGSSVEVYIWSPWRIGDDETITTTVSSDGSWALKPVRAPDAATHAYVTVESSIGDHVFDCHQLAALHVEIGSPIVRVEALYDVDADLILKRDGVALSRAVVSSRWTGSTQLRFAEAADAAAPLTISAGDELFGTLDDRDVHLVVPELEVSLESDPAVLTGFAVPGETIGLADAYGATEHQTIADAAGRFELPLVEYASGTGLLPGVSVAAFQRTRDGHTFERRWLGPSLELELGSPAVKARAMAGRIVTITHQPAHGSVQRIHGHADVGGMARLDLDQPVNSGDVITLDDGRTRGSGHHPSAHGDL